MTCKLTILKIVVTWTLRHFVWQTWYFCCSSTFYLFINFVCFLELTIVPHFCIYHRESLRFFHTIFRAHSRESELEPKMKHICHFKDGKMKVKRLVEGHTTKLTTLLGHLYFCLWWTCFLNLISGEECIFIKNKVKCLEAYCSEINLGFKIATIKII